MTDLEFAATFHGPFTISTGAARDGLDIVVDRDNPWPGSAIKGLMRAQTREEFLAIPKKYVDAVYGNERIDSPWIWTDADPDVIETPGGSRHREAANRYVRVRVDDEGRADERALVTGEQMWATSAAFRVLWNGQGTAPAESITVLRACARNIVSFGMNRRRGAGWVSVADSDSWTADDTAALLAIRGSV